MFNTEKDFLDCTQKALAIKKKPKMNISLSEFK